ncbi:hypothetical protein [Roseivivax lentus]|uniref:hypothetical protein n=1 Tax=Roseivivax lentus TaxID=633194 RepID=UPI00117A01F5|nr:hypothetical protein [Roseivivax lentus]
MKVEKRHIRSFRVHPLGFYYLVLSSGEVTRRLHVYSENADFSADNTWHTHEFDLDSNVLAGSIKNYIAEFVPDREANLKEFSVTYDDGRSILHETGRLGAISEVVNFTCGAGQHYFIKAGTIHRAKNIDSPCVTHVRMRHQGQKIFSYGSEESPFLRRQVSDAESSEVFEILRENDLIAF